MTNVNALPLAPTSRAIRILDGRTSPPTFISATLHRDFAPQLLLFVERTWSPGRTALTASGAVIENSHWDWQNKVWPVQSGRLRLVGIECEGEFQGLMALASEARPAILTPTSNVIYVDYLETAPWNLRVGGQMPRFLGAGSLLISEAIIISQELGFRGLVGLHSLPQASGFYAGNCQMTSTGPDPAYYDLEYFEYAAGVPAAWLAAGGRGV